MLLKTVVNTFFTQLTVITTVIVLGASVNGFSNSPKTQSLIVLTKINVVDGDLENTLVSVIMNGQVAKRIRPKKKRIKLELAFGQDYVIKFEKSGFKTKEVLINTRNVPLHMRDEYLDFGFQVDLKPEHQYAGISSDSLTMAQWRYHTDFGEFDFERLLTNEFADKISNQLPTTRKQSL